MEQILDGTQGQKAWGIASRRWKIQHEHNNRMLVGPISKLATTADREMAVVVRFARPLKQVTVDGPEQSLGLVHHAQLADVSTPHLPRPDVCHLPQPDAKQVGEQVAESLDAGAKGEVGRKLGAAHRAHFVPGDAAVVCGVPRPDLL